MTQRIRIDLQERLRGGSMEPVNVNIQWRVEITEGKNGFFSKLFSKNTHVHKLIEVKVDDIVVPEELVLSDRGSLFEIVYKDQRAPKVNVEMSDLSDQFQLLFNPAMITDCTRQQDAEPRIYTIKYSITWSDDSNATPKSEQYDLEVEIASFKLDPQIDIENLEDEFQYHFDMGIHKLCDIVVRQPEQSQYKFTPRQKMRLRLELKRNGSTKDITDRLHLFDERGDISQEFDLKEELRIPVYIDFTDFTNPIEDKEEYVVVPKIDVYACYKPQELKPQAFDMIEFELKKDPQGTELQIDTQCGNESRKIYEGSREGISARLDFVPRAKISMPVKLFLKNLATDRSNRNAGLRIKNLRVSHQLVSDNVIVIDSNGIGLKDDLTKLFELKGRDVEDMLNGNEVFVRNGAGQETAIELKFVPANVAKVAGGNANVNGFGIRSTVMFDYWEDSAGSGTTEANTMKTAKVCVNWNLHILPNPEWLCIDYGSSAIVCQYDMHISDLHARKVQIFKKYKGGKYSEKATDSLEKGSKFLSSDIVLAKVSDGTSSSLFCEQNENDEVAPDSLAICLSPTQGLINEEVHTQLPCLKILVGNETLPQNPHYLEYKYRRKESDGKVEKVSMKDAEQHEESSSLMRIFNIFSEAYRELIHFYIGPESKGKDINKLVLTYPTTYTPRHLRMLKRIVQANFKDLHPEYLKFVCESDAVAAYYINNWSKFNPGQNIADKNETLLVFDMGAGTLDLTLMRKTINTTTKRIEVEILAKIGTGKAGNYLDYVIAEILADKEAPNYDKYSQILKQLVGGDRNQHLISDIVSLESQPNAIVLTARLELKRLIKEVIKPRLVADGQIQETFQTNANTAIPIDIDCNDIINHPLFKKYLLSVCNSLVNKLIRNLPSKIRQVDRILMSGRGCRLRAIHDALGKVMSVKLIPFDIIGEDADKTAVVEGAMAYADSFSNEDSITQVKSRRLYANYGVAYRALGGAWSYVELIDSATLPTQLNSERLDDYQGQSKPITDVQQANKLFVIQSYMQEADTVKALNDNDWEFITVMEEISTDNFGRRNSLNVFMSIDYANNISLNVNGIVTQGSSPRGADLTSEITRRSVWPVII